MVDGLRAALVAILALLVASSAPLGSRAQGAPASGAFTITDPKDDMRYAYTGTPIPVPQGHWKGGDLLSLSIEESFEALAFTLGVQSLNAEPSGTYSVATFLFRGVPYHIEFGWFLLANGEQDTFGALYVEVEDGRWQRIVQLKPKADVAAATMTVDITRAYVLDRDGRMPVLGDALEGIHVDTNMALWLGPAGYLETDDRMPDEGDARYVVREGGTQAGHVRLLTYDPVRVSNGESSTFIYHVAVENVGDEPDTILLAATDVPERWSIRVEPSVLVPAQSKKDLVVLVSIPFAHDHGGFARFGLEAKSARDPDALATADLGILHTPIPQPAGHHSGLYLHTQDPNYHPIFGTINSEINPSFFASMNANSDHANDAANFVPSNLRWNSPTDSKATWWIPLDPGLQMGLDFDLTRKGHLTASIVGQGAKGEAQVVAEVLLTKRGEDPIVLAASAPAPLALDTQAPSAFELTLTATPEADYIPYEQGQNLVLRVEATLPPSFAVMGARPRMMTEDFLLHLPLLEYSDPVTVQPEVLGAVALVVDGPVDKIGKPGATLAFPLTLTNRGPARETYRLDLAGNDARVAQLAPSASVALKPGESAKLTMGVKLPTDANDEQSFEVLVVARAQSDPTVTAIVRTRSTAMLASDLAVDEALVFAAAQGEAETPGVALLALLGVAGAAAAVLRRRPS